MPIRVACTVIVEGQGGTLSSLLTHQGIHHKLFPVFDALRFLAIRAMLATGPLGTHSRRSWKCFSELASRLSTKKPLGEQPFVRAHPPSQVVLFVRLDKFFLLTRRQLLQAPRQ